MNWQCALTRTLSHLYNRQYVQCTAKRVLAILHILHTASTVKTPICGGQRYIKALYIVVYGGYGGYGGIF